MKDVMKSKIVRRLLFALTLSIFLTGCATTLPPTEVPAQRSVDEYVHKDVVYTIDVYDPIEGFNRGVYKFNYYFDKFIFLPVVSVYEFILPKFFQDRVSSAVDNIFEFNNLTNSLLQLEFKKAGVTVSRFAVNSTFGVLGMFDTASEMGLQRQNEDFGQTLGYYGVGHGPFIVLPVIGPSNLRDTTGLVVDAAAFSTLGPPAWVDDDDATLAFNIVSAVDKRHREKFRYYENGTPFEYDLVRLLYTKKRELDIDR
jgi:phospholipid-binding lipoprotein MlaA